ncbi:MAG: FapA family protein [Desulfobacula sp.]|uniref:flagellar assembly protein A n=1 Tax=Desulfobacula sp. TaxID=2593537 RepID=UPI0025BFD2F9|nr:flagellar assembly protein A [Desulfobacula sp.]MCD4719691.1 FapA family protein [Desulfobacula sp.]
MSDNSEYGILVVDDDEPIVKNMRRVLRRKGFTKITSALNGEQGIKLLETAQTPFFLIMSDQRMPGMSGSEFLEKSILLSPESRRMLITGYSDFDTIIDAVNKGEMHQYISKPWDNDDLLLRIMGELEIYKNFQERKHLYNVTKRQNAKLFDLASTQKKELQKFTIALENKKEEVETLVQTLKEAKEQAEFKEVFLGLDELLSRTITMNKSNLTQAFKIANKEVTSLVETISDRNKLSFSPDNVQMGDTDVNELEDEIFEIIDQIIENVVITVEPQLFGIGSEPSTGIVIDDYKQLPDFDELAFNDGFITKGEREKALEELEEKEAELSTGLTADKILIQNGFLRRQDLSRIFAKLAMIETRLLDRDLAKMMVNREIASKKDIDRAFRKQLNNFEDSGVAMLLGDILVESEIISPQIRDEIMATQDRTGKKKSAIDQSSQFSSEFGAFVDLQISEDKVQAWIRVPKTVQGTTDIDPVKKLIKKRGIKHGITDDLAIRKFLKNCTDPHEKFVVAQGIPPSVGKPARIIYHFNTQSDSAGVINEDGSIDFKSRGDSPFVKRGQVLAEKQPMEQPKSGIDIFGETLLVGDVDDVPLEGGEGVELSEDELKLTATITGQPSIDIKGIISVLESFTVKGDVDFKTGNINFNGNVIVTGTVKEGFLVECEDLTADEINGGIIRIRGDLKISNGVVNADIQTQGSVQAKFLNKTKVYGYGDIMITREIMESYIAISGALNNEAGRITACTIAARKGMSVKQIGTEKSEYSTVKTGADDHIRWIAEKYDTKIEKKQRELDVTIAEKMEHDEAYNGLHVDIANQTFAQEKITKKIDFLENKIGEVKEKEEKARIVKDLKELETTVQQSDERIKAIFEEQDIVQQKSTACEKKIEELNEEIKTIQKEKEKLIGKLEKENPVPELKVSKKLYTGTRITGTQASMILKQDLGASKFTEIDSENPDSPKQLIHQTLNL